MSALESSGKPLFFPVGNPAVLGLEAPALRRGEAVRVHVRALGGMQKEALVVGRRTGLAWRLASDEGAYLNGDDVAPCPLSFLTTGMVCSYMNELLALAKSRGIAIENLRLIQDNYYTMQGSALKGTMKGGARDVELEAQIESDAGRDLLTELLHDATHSSPLNGLLRHERISRFALRHNGRALDAGRLAPIDGAPAAILTDEAFDAAMPAGRVSEPGIARNGPSPRTAEITSAAGSSLAEHQDRVLHVRGICTLRPDGIKAVEQQLFNPHGSIFHYLCEEAPVNGGRGRAPDAATYISAGIAFCFMTQLGRYAHIAKRPLDDYRIVQDTHFSRGSAFGDTGAAGDADPVETAVAIESAADDDFARRALEMSEQTCFLHALCRTPLRTRIRVRDFGQAAA